MNTRDWNALAAKTNEDWGKINETQITVRRWHRLGPLAMLLQLYRGNNCVSFGGFELENHHAIPGIHFETLLIRGQRTSRGGGHIEIAHNLLPVRENAENAVAGMERWLHEREDHAVRTISDGNTIGKKSGTVSGRDLRAVGPSN